MSHLIVVTSAQLKTYRARFEKLLAQDRAEQARLREIEQRREAELNHLLETRPGSQASKEGRQS